MKLVHLMIENPNATAGLATVVLISLAILRLMIKESREKKIGRT